MSEVKGTGTFFTPHPTIFTLFVEGKKTSRTMQRLVYSAFHGPIPDGYQVDHVNHQRSDNRLENLQLLTPAENQRKTIRAGRNNPPKGEGHRWARLTVDQVREIRRRAAAGERSSLIATDFGIRREYVWAVATGRSWRHVN